MHIHNYAYIYRLAHIYMFKGGYDLVKFKYPQTPYPKVNEVTNISSP